MLAQRLQGRLQQLQQLQRLQQLQLLQDLHRIHLLGFLMVAHEDVERDTVDLTRSEINS
jgi:hypothetical protein